MPQVNRLRQAMRLKGHDYAQLGAYFVTFCAQHGECLFGEVVDGDIVLNPAGEMVWRWWHELPRKFPQVENDAAVVMPNPFHGIVMIVGQAGLGQEPPSLEVLGTSLRAAPTDVAVEDPAVGATLSGALAGAPMRGGQVIDARPPPSPPRGRLFAGMTSELG